jgi:DNA primase
MFIVNGWAATYFETCCTTMPTASPSACSISAAAASATTSSSMFQLGYDLPDKLAPGPDSSQKGYKEEFLLKTGIFTRPTRRAHRPLWPGAWCFRGWA